VSDITAHQFHAANIEIMQLQEYPFKDLDRKSSEVRRRWHSGPELDSFRLRSKINKTITWKQSARVFPSISRDGISAVIAHFQVHFSWELRIQWGRYKKFIE
jgi:hypothetical protein